MIKVEFLKAFNIDGAIRGMRNPKKSWGKSDSYYANVKYDDNGEYNADNHAKKGNRFKLFAKWTANTYTINYDAKDGKVNPTSNTKTFEKPLDLPKPTKEGYTFDGWYFDEGV